MNPNARPVPIVVAALIHCYHVHKQRLSISNLSDLQLSAQSSSRPRVDARSRQCLARYIDSVTASIISAFVITTRLLPVISVASPPTRVPIGSMMNKGKAYSADGPGTFGRLYRSKCAVYEQKGHKTASVAFFMQTLSQLANDGTSVST